MLQQIHQLRKSITLAPSVGTNCPPLINSFGGNGSEQETKHTSTVYLTKNLCKKQEIILYDKCIC